jgi:hypothetical protein
MRNKAFPLIAISSAALLALLITPSATGSYRHSGNPRIDEAAANYNNFASCIKCHDTYALNSGDGYMTAAGMPTEYVPGQTYPITITVADPGSMDWGYEFVITDEAGSQAGLLVNPDSNSQIRTSNGREFGSHKNGGHFEGVVNGPVSWTVDWVAPAAGTGRVALYTAGAAADDNDSDSRDYIYIYALASQEIGVGSNDAATLTFQANFPDQNSGNASNELIRGVDNLETNLWVRNHGTTTETYGVVTRVKLPNGAYYPPTGWLTQNVITLAPGENGAVLFDQFIPGVAPTGNYTLEGYVGFAPSTLVTLSALDFIVIP